MNHRAAPSTVQKVTAGARPGGAVTANQGMRNRRRPSPGAQGDGGEGADADDEAVCDGGDLTPAPPLLDGGPARSKHAVVAPPHQFVVAALSSRMQDAVLQGLGVLNEEIHGHGDLGVLRPVASGRALFCADAKKSLAVWAAATSQGVSFYCSCGTDKKDENVSALVRTGLSSSCRHASALSVALRGAADHLRCASVRALLHAHPSLDNAKASPTNVEAVLVSDKSDGSRVHAVAFDGIWAVVHTAPLRARRGRPVCTHLPCRTRSTTCVHSCAVKAPQAGYGAFGDGSDVEQASEEEEDMDSDVSLADGTTEHPARPPDAPPRRRPAAPSARKKGLPREFIDTDHPRRARNMLPCESETAACRRWDKLARCEVVADGGELDLFEGLCTSCGQAAVIQGKAVTAELHTLSGLLNVRTFKTKCTAALCGKDVRFDGSCVGLFCYSEQTVYTRTFLDVILFTIISTKSSISAASAVSAFQLHCTGSVYLYDTAQSRQELSKATDQYSRTLFIPSQLYKYEVCYSSSGKPYLALVVDGQIIGIFREASFPFERVSANVPTIPISIDNACAVPSAKVRKCVRQRLKAAIGEQVTFSSADQVAMAKFVSVGGVAPPFGDHASAGHRAETAEWAACCFFSSFFKLTAVARQADACSEAAPATPPPAGEVSMPGDVVKGIEEQASKGTSHVRYCVTIPYAIGVKELLPVVKRERWSIIYAFFRTFVAEPVIGAFSGCAVDDIKKLAVALVSGKKKAEWMKLSPCVHKLHVVWPALDMLADDMDSDLELCRAFGELLMFALHTDQHMEDLWRSNMNADSLRFEAKWTHTDAAKFRNWRQQQPAPATLPSGLMALPGARGRAAVQAEEVRSGIVFPTLEQVRPHGSDAVAAAARQVRKEKAEADATAGVKASSKVGVKVGSKRKRADMLDGGLGDDDCRHAFLTHLTFTPGVVSYVCSCGILIGFEVLETAESPAGIVSTLASRFPRLPTTV